ncbi:hypothetical protein [Streptomyces colonosanans]|uniref:Secreted protein n=1 Tax=Streptomyces colonosanans TaxID=1428652 RepID=A0A1S2PXR4_9ACTN|nr:hypothetical protein [Streptomyces colonosanans]OIJ98372.1 hypothetical protein BIV24_05870 [Streptomyces colonosanans]
MISTRRIVAAVSLAVGVTGLAAPLAAAAPAGAARDVGNPVTLLDSLSRTGIPPEHQNEMPRPSGQIAGQLHQATDIVEPVTGRLPVGRH